MQKSLKQKTISGMIWNGLERFGSTLFLFISNLILARLLSPEDFGAIGMLMVFISASQVIIDGGFGAALIQKKEPTQRDYSTIFFWNTALSILLYITLYFCSPAIANFYEIPSLTELLRVMGVVILFNSLFIIQNNILKKSINFKKVAKINLLAIVAGTILGIVAAYCGYGVWSLVIKTISTAIIQCILFWATSKWRPQLIFCWKSFKSLFAFGGYMFLVSTVNTLYLNTATLIIGKFYSPALLGFFSQARKLEDIPRGTIASAVNSVSLPVFSQLQDNKEGLKNASKKMIKGMAFINLPIMLLMLVAAKPLILFLFSERWEQSITFFQILCTHGLIYFLFEINSAMIAAIGKSNLFLNIRLKQFAIAVILMLLGAVIDINFIVIGYTLSAYISFYLIAQINKKYLSYGFFEQLKDISIYLILSIISAIISYSIVLLDIQTSDIIMIIIHSTIFIISYLSLCYICKINEMNRLLNIFKKR